MNPVGNSGKKLWKQDMQTFIHTDTRDLNMTDGKSTRLKRRNNVSNLAT